ncbi:hypothetical protein PR048_001411 [Dryococelus australis]|uniref:Uncharacterized protein n=1 Tax=Dryococelus australis TaxID=614101 RepID=A0ABQ9IHE6_9NEOP|nr:hypothetical protein PR048_001411 [Dryococelus australis]
MFQFMLCHSTLVEMSVGCRSLGASEPSCRWHLANVQLATARPGDVASPRAVLSLSGCVSSGAVSCFPWQGGCDRNRSPSARPRLSLSLSLRPHPLHRCQGRRANNPRPILTAPPTQSLYLQPASTVPSSCPIPLLNILASRPCSIHDYTLRNYRHIHISGAAVAEWLARSPPTKAIRVQSPAGSPDPRMWESCRILGDLPLPHTHQSRAAPYSPQSPSSALKTSLFKSHPILFPHSPHQRTRVVRKMASVYFEWCIDDTNRVDLDFLGTWDNRVISSAKPYIEEPTSLVLSVLSKVKGEKLHSQAREIVYTVLQFMGNETRLREPSIPLE